MLPNVHISKRLCERCQGAGRVGLAPCNGCAGCGRQVIPVRLDNTRLGQSRTLGQALRSLREQIAETEDLQEGAWRRGVWDVHETAAARLATLRAVEYTLEAILEAGDRRPSPSALQQILEAA